MCVDNSPSLFTLFCPWFVLAFVWEMSPSAVVHRLIKIIFQHPGVYMCMEVEYGHDVIVSWGCVHAQWGVRMCCSWSCSDNIVCISCEYKSCRDVFTLSWQCAPAWLTRLAPCPYSPSLWLIRRTRYQFSIGVQVHNAMSASVYVSCWMYIHVVTSLLRHDVVSVR